MSPDDPRHGTPRGYSAHRRAGVPYCDACREAIRVYQHQRVVDQIIGRPRSVPAVGFRRRIEALQAIGWSLNEIGRRLGIDVRVLPARMDQRWVRRVTHDRMAAIYDELSMTVPGDRYANRRRILAARKGYAPPLAWDDIDDPDERPNFGEHVPGARARLLEDYRWLIDGGCSVEEACERLGVQPDSITAAMRRAA